ncbi:MAG: PucR family transcriptional regulator [Anaerovoracaceae bacterium]|jgi:hypothetical protein
MLEDNVQLLKEKMFQSLTGDGGLQDLINTAAKVIDNPIGLGLINDSTRYVSWGMPKDSINPGTGLLEKVNITDLFRPSIQSHEDYKPIHTISDIDIYEHIFAPLQVNGFISGAFSIVLSNRPYKHEDIKMAEVIQQVFELALRTDMGESHPKKKEGTSNLLQSLIKGERIFMSHYALWKELGLEEGQPLQMIAVANINSKVIIPPLPIIEKIQRVLKNSSFIIKDGLIIFLCNYNVKDNREEVSNVLSKYELMAGASYPFHKLEEMKERYQQAVEVMEIERNKDDSNIYFYDEKVFDIIAKTKDLCSQNNLINFCHPALWKIHNYDDKNNTALLETLEVYLSCERNLESTSKILQVHRNTVLQRLNKITELTNSYSFSADSLYNMYISIMLIRKNLCKHSNTRTANHK